MKRLIASLLVICNFQLAYAAPVTVAQMTRSAQLATAYNEMNFALETQWDQKSPSFLDNEKAKFNAKITDLKAQGLTKDEMIEFAKTAIADKQTAADFETLIATLDIAKLKDSEVESIMTEFFTKSYREGASWSTRVGVVFTTNNTLIGLIVLGLFIALLVHKDKEEDECRCRETCDESAIIGEYNCRTEYPCGYCTN